MAMSMDRSSKSASGIPRLSSRLPLPQKSVKVSKSSIRPPVAPLSAHTADWKQETAQQKRPTADVAAPDGAIDTSIVKGLAASNISNDAPSSSKYGEAVGSAFEPTTGADSEGRALSDITIPPATPKEKRRPRPSLSDRTIETLAQIPPSPVLNRRRSSFFNRDESSPMRPPLRPASAMSNSRSRPSSPTKRPPIPSLPTSFAAKSSSKPISGRSSTTQPTRLNAAQQPKPSTKMGVKLTKAQDSSKPTSAARQTMSAPPNPALSPPAPKMPPTRRRLPTTPQTSHPRGTPRQRSPSATSTPSKSVPLHEAIAMAKQELARKKAALRRQPQSGLDVVDAGLAFGSGPGVVDPGNNSGLLRSRIKGALSSGHLNAAAMGLKSIPEEVKRMYDLRESTGIEWSEYVDLTKLIAADNELEILQDEIFPDLTNDELIDAESTDYCAHLRGLEVLDMHNNLLTELPLGLRRLQSLRTLNLSGNKLGMSSLEVVSQIGESLVELRMADNKMSGPLSDQVENLRNLQILDLHENKITELPHGFHHLLHLKILNLAQNRLSSVPSGLMTNSTLVELIVSGNGLSGVLFQQLVDSSVKNLKLLDVSHNALEALAAEEVALPNLQTVNLSANRLKTLPDVSSWGELLTFAIAENQISEIPCSLTKLLKLRNADLSNNNISKLDQRIGLMKNLASMNLAGNPLRERKYLTMSTDDLKADLLKRIGTTLEENVVSPATSSGSSTLLDLSSRSLSDSTLPSLSPNGPIFDLRLHHNALISIPAPLLSDASISATLKSLELSYNPFSNTYLSSPLSLPQLRDLSLASCTLKTLDNLTSNLSSSNLTTLNISANQLSGPLPKLRTHFPILTTLLASDNQFTSLPVDAVKGLTTLDIRNNQLGVLDPKLGLLSGKGMLQSLQVSGNKFRVPRWDILDKGTEAVLRYLRGRVSEEEVKAWEAEAGGCDE